MIAPWGGMCLDVGRMIPARNRVTGVDDPLFAASMKIYQSSFPDYERRRAQDFPVAFAYPGFFYETFTDDTGAVLAMMVTWRRRDYAYLEYLAVAEQSRGQGIGAFILERLCSEFPCRVILEIDPPADEVSLRRLGFYRRHGFIPNPQFDYIHPPYTDDGAPFPLLVMSHGQVLSDELYRDFEHFHHTRVVAR